MRRTTCLLWPLFVGRRRGMISEYDSISLISSCMIYRCVMTSVKTRANTSVKTRDAYTKGLHRKYVNIRYRIEHIEHE